MSIHISVPGVIWSQMIRGGIPQRVTITSGTVSFMLGTGMILLP